MDEAEPGRRKGVVDAVEAAAALVGAGLGDRDLPLYQAQLDEGGEIPGEVGPIEPHLGGDLAETPGSSSDHRQQGEIDPGIPELLAEQEGELVVEGLSRGEQVTLQVLKKIELWVETRQVARDAPEDGVELDEARLAPGEGSAQAARRERPQAELA